jgi:hypothetical protein
LNIVETSDKWFLEAFVSFRINRSGLRFRCGKTLLAEAAMLRLRARANTGAPRSSVDYDDEGVAGTEMPLAVYGFGKDDEDLAKKLNFVL